MACEYKTKEQPGAGRSEQELGRLSRQYELILESTAEGIYGIDAQGNGTFINRAASRMLGYEAHEVIGRHAHSLVHYSRSDGSPYPFEQCPTYTALRSGTVSTMKNEVLWRKDGTSFPAEYTVIPVYEAQEVTGAVITFKDITERKRAEEELKESNRRISDILESISDGFFALDEDLRVTYFNKAAERLLGRKGGDVLGRRLFETFPEAKGSIFDEKYTWAVREKKPVSFETYFDVQPYENWYEVRVYPLEKGISVYFQVTTERKQAEQTIQYQAYHDLLTGLPNKALLMDHLGFEMPQMRRVQKRLAVLFLDIDHFKNVNDSLGHGAGDALIKDVAARLKSSMREFDFVDRIGGDVFTVLLPFITAPDDASRIAEEIKEIFNEPFIVSGHELRITASIGISLYPDDSEHAETLLKSADIALHYAKDQGRNNYQFFDPAMNTKILERMILENGLRRTLERGELEVFYQPQFDIATGKIVCLEALIRWRHPEMGLMTPVQFMPLAEEIGFIASVDEWVLRTACEQNRSWQKAGFPPACITVNLSPRQFRDPKLVALVSRILEEADLEPGWLELEVTETVAMEDIERTMINAKRLAELGVKFSIDDFGTGYSSLSYLKKTAAPQA